MMHQPPDTLYMSCMLRAVQSKLKRQVTTLVPLLRLGCLL